MFGVVFLHARGTAGILIWPPLGGFFVGMWERRGEKQALDGEAPRLGAGGFWLLLRRGGD
ncbi:MAG: hypothetical protein COY40_04560 [Alphaproteobacteria bacterium CG_4_10_14_0_8_um_filter_53_9]|nr:MAG: hypothetical protein COY40_04560 [Alphaproteobacteria bacterium CG_4_10_14_0_8_um_filter_53_9]